MDSERMGENSREKWRREQSGQNCCHRVLCEQRPVYNNVVRIMLVRYKIGSMNTCEKHFGLMQLMTQNLFMELAKFWFNHQRCLEETWEQQWSNNIKTSDLKIMFKEAINGLKTISFIRNETKPELLLQENFQLLEEVYETIALNTRNIKNAIMVKKRYNKA